MNEMISDLLPVHNEMHRRIDEIDTKLDSLLDPTSAGRSKIINERVEANKERANAVINHLVAQLENSPIDEKIGMYYALIRGLDSVYKAVVTPVIDELVKNQPTVTPLIDEEEAKLLSAIRSDLASKVKQIIAMAQVFANSDAIPEGMKEPKKRTGKAGKRGPRALSFYSFTVGDKEYEDLNAVAEDYAQYFAKGTDIGAAMRGDYTKVKDDGKEIKVRGMGKNADGSANTSYIDTQKPPEPSFSFTLPNGDVLTATKDADNGVEDDEPELEDTDGE